MNKRKYIVWLMVLLLIPATLFLGTKLPGRSYYLTSTLVILETMLPFFLLFERRRPQARELVLVAVMCALAVASRAVFAWSPFLKPIIGIVMIAGIALGPESGFLIGAVSAFASNFVFGQGPWTPWQMLAYGAGGLLAGIICKKWDTKKPLSLALLGFFLAVFLVGLLLDTCTVFTTLTRLTVSSVLAVYSAGIPANLANGISVFVTVLLLSKPLLSKLERVKMKYGLLESDEMP